MLAHPRAAREDRWTSPRPGPIFPLHHTTRIPESIVPHHMEPSDNAEASFRRIFRRLHARHAACAGDEWLNQPCRNPAGEPDPRPVIWSRRNGPWNPVDILWVGAAPGNAGDRGSGLLGAHGTRIPFGGDIAGANLDVLLGSIGLTRNDTFITAALNQLPASGGGEPSAAELAAPAGDYPTALHALRDTILAARPRLLVALGNVAIRATLAAARLEIDGPRLPTPHRLAAAGLQRGRAAAWPSTHLPDPEFLAAWHAADSAADAPDPDGATASSAADSAADAPATPAATASSTARTAALPHLLWLTHPSAQNMSPFARTDTLFHTRMLDARRDLRTAVRDVLGWTPPPTRPPLPRDGIYALPEWHERIRPRHERLDALWRAKGV